MKWCRSVAVLIVSIIALGGTAAWAQLGLYGSPDMLVLPDAAHYGSRAPDSMDSTLPGVSPRPTARPAPSNWTTRMAPPRQRPFSGLVRAAGTDAAWPFTAGPDLRNAGHGMFQRAPDSSSMGAVPSQFPGMAEPIPAPAGPHEQGILNSYGDQGYDPSNPFSDQPAYRTQATDGCETEPSWPCPTIRRSPWYGSISALVMGRNNANRVWTSYDWTDEAIQFTHTQDIKLKWGWGGEVRLGRRFCCDRWAVEATYWTLERFQGFVRTTNGTDQLGTPFELYPLQYFYAPSGLLEGADQWFDNSPEHRLWRRNEFHNVEINLIRRPVMHASAMPWEVDWLVGVRYFRFQETLIFGAVADGFTWDTTPVEEAFLNDHITNNLIGLQFGFDANVYLHPAWRVFFTPKFGIYDNHIEHTFRAYLGDGTIGTSPDGTYPVRSSTDVVSFAMQIDLGFEWHFASRWNARLGYRVFAATGIGLADNQFPFYIADVPEIADIGHNGDLILHGAFAGVTYNF